MSAWFPKASKLGIIRNILYEPHKPVPLVTKLNNGVEFISCVLTFQYSIQGTENQQDKY